LLPWLVALVPVATVLTTAPSFADSNREYRALDVLAAHVDPGSAVADVDLGSGDASRTFSMATAVGRVLATRGGRLAVAFTSTSVSPVMVAPGLQWNESLMRLGIDSQRFEPEHDLRLYRYVFVRFSHPSEAAFAMTLLRPEAEAIDVRGEWMLFRSRLRCLSLLSPDLDAPGPPVESIRDRARAFALARHR
jgi:hypothetical protein